jgi:hypothetical protein
MTRLWSRGDRATSTVTDSIGFPRISALIVGPAGVEKGGFVPVVGFFVKISQGACPMMACAPDVLPPRSHAYRFAIHVITWAVSPGDRPPVLVVKAPPV